MDQRGKTPDRQKKPHNTSKRAAVDPRLRPRAHRVRLQWCYLTKRFKLKREICTDILQGLLMLVGLWF